MVDAELGARVVFFTGGTALRDCSQHLSRYTFNSVHLVTPFDSGGSSARLRACIPMPAIGDIRNRLLALADRTVVPDSVFRVCEMRLPLDEEPVVLLAQLQAMVDKGHSLWNNVPRFFAEALRVHIRYFLEHMPASFDPRGANIGNLALTGGYLHHGRRLEPVLHFYSRLLQVRGIVLPLYSGDLHLVAELSNGSRLLGQHRITGKESHPVSCPITKLFLTEHHPDACGDPLPVRPKADPLALTFISTADVNCYPMGSFWTSVVANLLPEGVGKAIALTDCAKVYIPNIGHDPEQLGMSVADAVAILLQTLRQDSGQDTPAAMLVERVFVDTERGDYAGGVDKEGILAQGVAVVDTPLLRTQGEAHHDAALVTELLLGCLK